MPEDFVSCVLLLEIEIPQNGISISPGGIPDYTETTQDNNRNDGNDDGGIILLLGLFSDGGHLIGHDFFSL